MLRRPIIVGNWKMNKTIFEAIELVNALKRVFFEEIELDIVVCPPYISLSEVSSLLQDSSIKLGAQNLHWQESGAFTGEISVLMLKDIGVKFVIIGHSERRQFFGETNEKINKKIKAAIKHGLVPIICVGERLEEREKGRTFAVVKEHIESGLAGLNLQEAKDIVIAYEPVWAIGTGMNATPEQAEEVHSYIRRLLSGLFGETISRGIRIQYGGSVKPGNIEELMREEDIDGALVGGASLNMDSFKEIIIKTQAIVIEEGK